jgi:hypothetical protein
MYAIACIAVLFSRLAQASYPDPLDIWNFIALQKNNPKAEYAPLRSSSFIRSGVSFFFTEVLF